MNYLYKKILDTNLDTNNKTNNINAKGQCDNNNDCIGYNSYNQVINDINAIKIKDTNSILYEKNINYVTNIDTELYPQDLINLCDADEKCMGFTSDKMYSNKDIIKNSEEIIFLKNPKNYCINNINDITTNEINQLHISCTSPIINNDVKEEILNKASSNKYSILFIYSVITDEKINSDSFKNLIGIYYLKYPEIELSKLKLPSGKYCAKHFVFIDIPESKNYKYIFYKEKCIINLYIDNNLIARKYNYGDFSLVVDPLYLTKGVHLIYTELTFDTNNLIDSTGFEFAFSPYLYADEKDTNKYLSNFLYKKNLYTFNSINSYKLDIVDNLCNVDNLYKYDTCAKSVLNTNQLDEKLNYNETTKYNNIIENIYNENMNKDLRMYLKDKIKYFLYNSLSQYDTDKVSTSNIDQLLFLLPLYLKDTKDIDLVNNYNILKHCENIKDSAINVDNKLCNYIYNDEELTKDDEFINKSKFKILTNYCITKDTNNKYKFENKDPKCMDYQNEFSEELLIRKCLDINDNFLIDNEDCNNLVDSNILNIDKNKVVDRLIFEKNRYMVNEINNISDIEMKTIDYATNLYPSTKDSNVNLDILNSKVTEFCETNDKNLINNKNCIKIYNKFNDSENIILSRKKMRAENCSLYNNINSNYTDDISKQKNINECKSFIFDTSNNENIILFSGTVRDYCKINNKKQTCKDYYNNIKNKLLEYTNLAKQIPDIISDQVPNIDISKQEVDGLIIDKIDNTNILVNESTPDIIQQIPNIDVDILVQEPNNIIIDKIPISSISTQEPAFNIVEQVSSMGVDILEQNPNNIIIDKISPTGAVEHNSINIIEEEPADKILENFGNNIILDKNNNLFILLIIFVFVFAIIYHKDCKYYFNKISNSLFFL